MLRLASLASLLAEEERRCPRGFLPELLQGLLVAEHRRRTRHVIYRMEMYLNHYQWLLEI